MSSENEFLVTFTFGLGEFESVCIPLLFTGCECQKRISCGTEKKGRIRCICGATSEKDWDILAMLAACQVNKTDFDGKGFRQELIALCYFIPIKSGFVICSG